MVNDGKYVEVLPVYWTIISCIFFFLVFYLYGTDNVSILFKFQKKKCAVYFFLYIKTFFVTLIN